MLLFGIGGWNKEPCSIDVTIMMISHKFRVASERQQQDYDCQIILLRPALRFLETYYEAKQACVSFTCKVTPNYPVVNGVGPAGLNKIM